MDESVFAEIRKSSIPYFRLSHHCSFHTERVHNLATRIAQLERADADVVRAAALLHDIARAMEDEGEIADHSVEGAKIARRLLESLDFPSDKVTKVVSCIQEHRFAKGVKPTSLEAEVLQDADRLDVLGAIGIARVFARGGWANMPMHDPTVPPKKEYDGRSLTSINHIYEKVLKVRNSLNTETAKRIGDDRHYFVKQFLERFMNEWDGKI